MAGPAASGWRSVLEEKWTELATQNREAPGSLPSADLLLPAGAGTLHVAVDAEGRRHMLVQYSDAEVIPEDKRSGGIHLTSRRLLHGQEERQFADVVCVDKDLSGVFASLAVSVIELFATGPSVSPVRLQALLSSWRRLLAGRASPWTVSRAAGLFGELLVLRRLLEVSAGATASWRGPLGEAQDFRSTRHAIEVKTTVVPTGRVVSVHGLDQLEVPSNGTLTLAWLRLATAGKESQTIDDLAEECRVRTSDPELFDDLLNLLGWPGAPDDVRSLQFSCVEERWSEVDADFPRLCLSSLGGFSPPGVSSVNYQLDLDFVRPDSPDRRDAVHVLGSDL